jgi:hypothetical protein
LKDYLSNGERDFARAKKLCQESGSFNFVNLRFLAERLPCNNGDDPG